MGDKFVKLFNAICFSVILYPVIINASGQDDIDQEWFDKFIKPNIWSVVDSAVEDDMWLYHYWKFGVTIDSTAIEYFITLDKGALIDLETKIYYWLYYEEKVSPIRDFEKYDPLGNVFLSYKY